MATHKLHRPPGPPACTPTKAARLCAERAALDAERLELDRATRSLGGKLKTIDDELLRFARTADPPVVELARWRIEVVQAPGFFSYKDHLVEAIGLEQLEAKKASVPTKDKLQLTEVRPAKAARATGKKAA